MKRLSTILLIVGIVVILVACGGNKVDETTAKKYISAGEKVIELLNREEYDTIYEQFNEEMKEALPIDEMNVFTPIINESGTYEGMDKTTVEESEGYYYITTIVAKYSEKKRIYTITFEEDERIAGLFIK